MGSTKDEQSREDYRVKALLRDLKKVTPELLEDLSIGAEQELANRESDEKGKLVHIEEVRQEIEDAAKTWGKVSGISTGYPQLDDMIGGLKKEEIILIGGETNNGKSALAQNIAVNVAREHTVLFITLEMAIGEAGSRFKYMNGGSLDGLDLLFQVEKDIDYRHLEPIFENAKSEGVDVVILDYLQYLGRGMDLNEVAKMSKQMKKLARMYQVPFVIIVSLRKGEGGKFKRKWTDIEVEDLMGTSAIGYDTDVALIASRKNQDNQYEVDGFWVKVIKARNMQINYDDRYLEFKWDKTRIIEKPKLPEWVPADDDLKEAKKEDIPTLLKD